MKQKNRRLAALFVVLASGCGSMESHPGPPPLDESAARFDSGAGRGDAAMSEASPDIDAGASIARDGGRLGTHNILLILLDDFGVDVAGFYPPESRTETTIPPPPTPNLSRLARDGVLFDNAWANPFCAPSRATILTGRYGFRTGIGNFFRDETYPVLRFEEFTLPQAFLAQSDFDFRLAHVGKFHMTSRWFGDARTGNEHGWPHFAGHLNGRLWDYFSWPKNVNGETTTQTTYATTDNVNESLAFIRQARSEGRPYFLWLGFDAPHAPFHKPPSDLHSYDSLEDASDERETPRPYYEAMCEAADTEIGRLLEEVDLETTTVIVAGDNGTPDVVISDPHEPLHAKGTVYETGVRIPLLIAGRGVAEPGRMIEALVNTVDLFPTVLELAGIDISAVLPGDASIDGHSLVPYLENQAGERLREWVYAEKFHQRYDERAERALRNDRYKLLVRDNGRELYDLARDPLEETNLLEGPLTRDEQQALSWLEQRLAQLLATR